jgi:inner membrane transporter RhtA
MVIAPLLVVAAAVSTQFGQAFSKMLSGQVGPLGVVALRLGFAAAILIMVQRPSRPVGDRQIKLIVLLGLTLAGMNLIYPAMHYLPIGVASTVQMLGPLAVALWGSRQMSHLAAVIIAGIGIWLVNSPTSGASLPWQGMLLALGSATSMGAYLVVGQKVSATSARRSALPLALVVAAVLGVPAGIVDSGNVLLQPSVLLAGAGVAVLTAILPWTLELAALRQLNAGVVGVLLALEPVVAGIAGALLLHETLSIQRWLGIIAISLATALVMWRSTPDRHRSDSPGPARPRPVPQDEPR